MLLTAHIPSSSHQGSVVTSTARTMDKLSSEPKPAPEGATLPPHEQLEHLCRSSKAPDIKHPGTSHHRHKTFVHTILAKSSTMHLHQVPQGPLQNHVQKLGTKESCTQLQGRPHSTCCQSPTPSVMTRHTSYDSKGIQSNPVQPTVHLQVAFIMHIIDTTHQPAKKQLPPQDQALPAEYHHLTTEKGGKANAERACEDSNLCGSQHSPELANIVKLQLLHRASTTRPVCHEIFSQAKPTVTRPNLNNFHGPINQDARAST